MSSAIYQSGDARPVMIPVDVTNTSFNRGAAVALVSAKAQPASEFTWTTDTATTRKNFAKVFAGLTAQEKDAADYIWSNGDDYKDEVRVDVGGVHRVTVASGTYTLGQLLGPKKDSGNNLLDDTFEGVLDPAEAVLRVVGGYGVSPGTLEAEVLSRVFAAQAVASPVSGALVAASIAGGAAGNLTLTGISTEDELVAVWRLDRDATAANVNLTSLLSEFSIAAANTITNTGGTNTAGDALAILYWDRSKT